MIQKQLSNGSKNLELRLNLKQLELNALLEITEAINANLPEEALYKIYHFTLLSNLHINKLALFVNDDEWDCKVHYGCKPHVKEAVIDAEKLKSDRTCVESGVPALQEFDVVIPISHKKKDLAFVFIGGAGSIAPSAEEDDNDSVLSFVQTLTSILIVAIENKKLARRQLQQEALRKELEIASKVQLNLFPKVLPQNEKVKLCACYLPHLTVGGDYYDYLELGDGRFMICIADVSGKGIPAALLMSNFQASLRTLIRRTQDLKDIFRELNHLVKSNANGDRFITCFAAIIDTLSHTITYINGGHNAPIVLSGKELLLLEKGTTVMGAFDDLPFIEEGVVQIKPGSLIFSYTDGVTEVFNDEEEEYGVERLQEFLRIHKDSAPDALKENILRELNIFKGFRSFPDDITFLACWVM